MKTEGNVRPPQAVARELPGRLMAVTPDVGKLIDEAIAWERERHAEIVHYARMVRISATWACLDCLEAAVKEYDAAALPVRPDKPSENRQHERALCLRIAELESCAARMAKALKNALGQHWADDARDVLKSYQLLSLPAQPDKQKGAL